MLRSALIICVLFCGSMACAQNQKKPTTKPVETKSVEVTSLLQWLQKPWNEVACIWEKELGYVDEDFRCSSKKPAPGDPCKNPTLYNLGPSAPPSLAKSVTGVRNISNVELAWEHGELQSLTLTVKGKLDAATAEKMLNIQFEGEHSKSLLGEVNNPKNYPNILSISLQACSLTETCIVVQGFDHMGGAAVECN